MGTHRQEYYFGRLNLIGHIPDKDRLIFDSIRTGTLESGGKFRYGFFGAKEIAINEGKFAYGQLVKYKQLLEGEIVDEVKHELKEGGLPKGVVAKSDFFLHHNTGLIAYRPISNKLSDKQFREIFSSIFRAANQDFFIDAKIETIGEEVKINEAIQKMKSVTRISISIHPTNPHNRREYEELDNRLKQLEAKQLTEVLDSEGAGLNKAELLKDEAYKGILMAEDGYGSASVTGEYEGRRITVNTGDSPVKTHVDAKEDPSEVLSDLLITFRKIFKRINRN